VRIIRHHYSRSEEHVIFDHSELSNIDIAVHFDTTANRAAIVDDCIVPDAEPVANSVFLSDYNVMPRLQMVTDYSARVDNCTTANTGTRADDQGVIANASAGYPS